MKSRWEHQRVLKPLLNRPVERSSSVTLSGKMIKGYVGREFTSVVYDEFSEWDREYACRPCSKTSYYRIWNK